MKVSKNILEVDHALQSLIIGLGVTSVLIAIINHEMLIFYLLLQLAMGFWQVFSAFIIAIISGNQKRLQYLVAVAAYFLNAGLISYIFKDYVFEYEIAMAIIWIVVPVIYAIWYYKITKNDLKALNDSEINEDIFNSREFV